MLLLLFILAMTGFGLWGFTLRAKWLEDQIKKK